MKDRNTKFNRSRRICHHCEVSVAKKPMNPCACESEERGHGVGAGMNATLPSGTLYSMGLAEFEARARFRLRKKPMHLCMR
jgi:hypothetical protein